MIKAPEFYPVNYYCDKFIEIASKAWKHHWTLKK